MKKPNLIQGESELNSFLTAFDPTWFGSLEESYSGEEDITNTEIRMNRKKEDNL